MAYGIAYLVTNTVNGKPYVGQTTAPLRRRWASHVSLAKTRAQDTLLCRAIRKHGREAFTVERIVDAPDLLTLDAIERFWIGVFGSRSPHGYNTTDGGRSGTRQDASVRAKKGAAHRLRYQDPAQRSRQGVNASRYWATPGAREQLSATLKEVNAHLRKPVVAIRLRDGERATYAGIAEAERALGVNHSKIIRCLAGRFYQSHGYAFVAAEN